MAKTHQPQIHYQSTLEDFPTALDEVIALAGGLLGCDSGNDVYFGPTSLFQYSEG